MNNGVPSSKPKKYLPTDSAQVPWGKDEIEFKKLKRNRNLMLLLVGALIVTTYLLYNGSTSLY